MATTERIDLVRHDLRACPWRRSDSPVDLRLVSLAGAEEQAAIIQTLHIWGRIARVRLTGPA
jgi:hypothetical protein